MKKFRVKLIDTRNRKRTKQITIMAETFEDAEEIARNWWDWFEEETGRTYDMMLSRVI